MLLLATVAILAGPQTLQVGLERFRDLRMRTRDGVSLLTDAVRPKGSGPIPAILERSPLGRVSAMERAEFWARRGYAFVAQECRSGGEDEGRDGYDAVQWVARQPWCDGRVGLIGSSTSATTAALAAVERPPALRAMVLSRAHGRFDLGALRVPTMLLSRWDDAELFGTMLLWEGARRSGRQDVFLVYGPLERTPGVDGKREFDARTADFFDEAFRSGLSSWSKTPRARVFVTGAGRWASLDGWPPSTSRFETRYLSPDVLRETPPDEDSTVPETDREGGISATFKGEPLDAKAVIAGPFECRLFFRSAYRETALSAALLDIDSDGWEHPIGKPGRLHLATPVSGRVYSALLRPWDAARELPAGHRIALRVGISPTGEVGRSGNVILTGTVNPSRITFRELR